MTYFKDWFSRDADYGYTYYNPSQRAYSWDRGYTNYSDFFFGHSKKLNMEEAASLLSTMSTLNKIRPPLRKRWGFSFLFSPAEL